MTRKVDVRLARPPSGVGIAASAARGPEARRLDSPRHPSIREACAGFGGPPDLQRWIAAGLLSDVLDVAAGVVAARRTGWRGYLSAAIAAPMLPLGVAALLGARRAAAAHRA